MVSLLFLLKSGSEPELVGVAATSGDVVIDDVIDDVGVFFVDPMEALCRGSC
jgi:hypothetical protein